MGAHCRRPGPTGGHRVAGESRGRLNGARRRSGLRWRQDNARGHDRVRPGETELRAKVEADAAVHGDEAVFGGGKTMREGMTVCASVSVLPFGQYRRGLSGADRRSLVGMYGFIIALHLVGFGVLFAFV